MLEKVQIFFAAANFLYNISKKKLNKKSFLQVINLEIWFVDSIQCLILWSISESFTIENEEQIVLKLSYNFDVDVLLNNCLWVNTIFLNRNIKYSSDYFPLIIL